MIYLDNAATTKTAPEVVDAMLPYFSEYYGNASTIYSLGAESKKAMDHARQTIADSLGAKPEEIYFTAGGSESDNWALKATAEAYASKGKHIITTKIEHHAILHTCEYLEKRGFEITYLNVDRDGLISLDELKAAIRPDTILISVMFANNEIGTIEPIAEIGEIAKEHGVLFHTDAVQAYAQVPINVDEMRIDMLSASGHKLNGPKGIGFLYIRKGVKIRSFVHGGAQERSRRAGTENIPGIVGLGAAVERAMRIMDTKTRKESELRDYLMIALGMDLYGIGWTVFLLPNDITTGGVPGIASIVYFATGFPVQYTYFAINFLLLLLALRVLGWKFSVKTIFAVFTLTFFLSIIQKLTEGVVLLHDQPFMACVIGASFCGSGIGIAFSNNGSTGGTDIIAAVINKYRDITLGRVMLICDLIIISSSYFVLKDWEKVVYGYVTLYICSFVLDQVVNSARQSVQFFIISDKYEEIAKHIQVYPHRGATVINASGFYTGKEIKMLFVLAKKRESTIIFRLIKDIDPNAFVSQSAVIGVYGEGFDRIKVK